MSQNNNVKNEIKSIANYWIDLGVDGFRIDAAKHFFEHLNDQSKCIQWWAEFNTFCKSIKSFH